MVSHESKKNEISAKKAPSYRGSYMLPGDTHKYRSGTFDVFAPVKLAEVKLSAADFVSINDFIIQKEPGLKGAIESVFVPPIVSPHQQNASFVPFLKTGGRTYIRREVNADSAYPSSVFLNLKDFGWADTDLFQEFRPEIKGGGTLLDDAGLSLDKVAALAVSSNNPALHALVDKLLASEKYNLAITSLDDRGRPKGSQLELYEMHGLEVTKRLQTGFPVKFAPQLAVAFLPEEVQKMISFLNRGLGSEAKRCHDPVSHFVQGIRLTPSTVRGIYLDKAGNDKTLVDLASRISHDSAVLDKTGAEMINDVRRYLEVLATTTRRFNEGGYKWAKIGDIHLAWQNDSNPGVWDESEVNRYLNDHDYAWYLAKDVTVAGGTGFWFVDLESMRAGVKYQITSSSTAPGADLKRKHDLSVLCILRDFYRITTKFEVARHLAFGKSVSSDKRLEIQKDVLERIVKSINKSKFVSAQAKKDGLLIGIKYQNIGIEYSNLFPYRQLSPVY